MAMSDASRIQTDLAYSALAKTPRGESVRKMLEAHPSIKAATGRLWLNHLIYRPVASVIGDLTCWYLLIEDQQGHDAARKFLNDYFERETVRTMFCVWVFGIEPKRSYQFDGVSLVPVTEMPDSCERDEYLAHIRNHRSPVAHAAFTTETDIPRVVDDETAARLVESKLMQGPMDLLSEAVSLVNGIGNLSCLPHWHCTYQRPDVPFGPWAPTGRMARGFDVVGTHSRPFADEDSEALGEMLRRYHALGASDKQWIQVILERIQRSKRQGAPEGKILDLGIAAEMLLLRDQNETDPIALPFRLRGSWLLGSGHRRRLEIYELLKALYSYRCQIAHGGSFKGEKHAHAAAERIPEFYATVQEILRLAIRPTYPRNGADWLGVILGEGRGPDTTLPRPEGV